MTSPFELAKQHPNKFMIDHRNSGMKIQDPIFSDNIEDAKTKLKEVQSKGHMAFIYKIDENGKATIYKD